MAQAPATNHGLMANMVGRVIFAFMGILSCWVPFRLLVRNGEFAVVVLIIDVAIMNLITIVNSIIWHDDDWTTWWDGTGLCDIEVYLIAPLQTIFATSVFTVMYRLAQQVKVTVVSGRDRRLRTRRNLIQAAIIFPVPLLQLLFAYFDLAQRYIVGTLVGCFAVYDNSWPKILFYDAPPAVFAILSVPYAFLLWKRYRAISKQTQGFFRSDSQISIRLNRTRLRLYNMSLSILVVYLPFMLYYFICNIRATLSSHQDYDFNRIRFAASPYPWGTILFVPSWLLPSFLFNQPWIPISAAAVIVIFFGMTADARQTYLQYAEYAGLGPCLLKLRARDNQVPMPIDETGGSRGSGKTLLSNRPTASTGHHRDPNSIELTISQPENSRNSETRPSRIPQHHRPRTTLDTPPVIPPRFSSLRPSFALRSLTLQSIRRTIRIASGRSPAHSDDASGASIEAVSNLAEPSSAGSIPMLPLHRQDAEARGSFMARGSPTESPAGYGFEASRPGSRLQTPVPLAKLRSASARHDDGGRANIPRGAQSEAFPREVTLASFYTTSDTSEGFSWTTLDASSGVGIAK